MRLRPTQQWPWPPRVGRRYWSSSASRCPSQSTTPSASEHRPSETLLFAQQCGQRWSAPAEQRAARALPQRADGCRALRASSCWAPSRAPRAAFRCGRRRCVTCTSFAALPAPARARTCFAHRLPFTLCPARQVYELEGADAKLLSETEHKHGFKCGTFGASLLSDRCVVLAGPLSARQLEACCVQLCSCFKASRPPRAVCTKSGSECFHT